MDLQEKVVIILFLYILQYIIIMQYNINEELLIINNYALYSY